MPPSDPRELGGYAARDETRREHLLEPPEATGWCTFAHGHHCPLREWLVGVARTPDNAVFLAGALLGELRERRILPPAIERLERTVASARHRARREAHVALTADLADAQRDSLGALLDRHP